MMHFCMSPRACRTLVAIGLVLPLVAARAQAPSGAPTESSKIASVGVGAVSLSSNGASSIGWTAYYTGALMGHLVYDSQFAIFSENGATSSAAQFTAGYGFGPYLNPMLTKKQRRAMFFVGGGVWYASGGGASSTDPMLIVGGLAPIGPLVARLGYGMVMADGATVSLFNVGFGFVFGQGK